MLDLPDLYPGPLADALADVLACGIDDLLPPEGPLVAALAGLAPPVGLAGSLAGLGWPLEDLVGSPLALRAALLRAGQGALFAHHELRLRLSLPEGLLPDGLLPDGLLPGGAAATAPTWVEGHLVLPAPLEDGPDAALGTWTPTRPHQVDAGALLAGVAGFCWHPELTRFEAYLGARLAALVPALYARSLASLLAAPPGSAFWEGDRPAREAAALQQAARARVDLAREWQAIGTELSTGRPCPSPAPGWSASAQAEAALLTHWNRLTAWSFGAWVERFSRPGPDHSPDCWTLAARVAGSLRSLVSGPLPVDPVRARRGQERRLLQDLGARLLLILEHTGEGRVEQALLPRVDALAEAAGAVDEGRPVDLEGTVRAALAALDAVADRVPGDLAAACSGLGTRALLRTGSVDAGLDQVLAGLQEALPDTMAGMADPEDVAWRFATSTALDRPGSLPARFASWWEEEGGADPDLVRLEALVRDTPRGDAEGELFAVVPEAPVAPGQGVCRLNRSLRRAWLDAELFDAEEQQIAPRDEHDRVQVAVAWLDGAPRVLVLDAAAAAALDAVAAGRPAPWSALLPLVEAGLVLTWPAPPLRE